MSKTKSILLIFISLIVFSDIFSSGWLGLGRSERKNTFDQILKIGSGAVLGGVGAVLLSGSLPFITLCTIAGGFLSREATIINQSSQSSQELLSDYKQRGLQLNQLQLRMQGLTGSFEDLRSFGDATTQQLQKADSFHKETAANLIKNDIRVEEVVRTAIGYCNDLLNLKSKCTQEKFKVDDTDHKILKMIDSFEDKPVVISSTIAGLKDIARVRDVTVSRNKVRSHLLGSVDVSQLRLLEIQKRLADMAPGSKRAEADSSFGGAGAGSGRAASDLDMLKTDKLA